MANKVSGGKTNVKEFKLGSFLILGFNFENGVAYKKCVLNNFYFILHIMIVNNDFLAVHVVSVVKRYVWSQN